MDIALSYQHISSRLISAILLAGLILALLMPLGITVGINTITFDVFFVLYSLIHLGAVVVALQILLRLCIDASRWPTLTAAISTLLLAILVLNCVPPITARDALVHHLAVPRLWLAAGHVYEIAWHDWSYYPMLLNMAYTGLLKFNLEWLAPFYHLSYFLLLGAIVAVVLIEQLPSADGQRDFLAWLGYTMCFSLPICQRLASTPLVDAGLALYFGLAWLLLIRWATIPERYRLAVYAGVSIGLALSTKYNGLLAVAVSLPAFLLLCLRTRIPWKHCVVAGVCVTGVGLVCVSPWLIKNYVWTDNPIYPLYHSFFASDVAGETVRLRGLKPLQYRMVQYGETWSDLLLIPLRMLFSGRDFSPQYFDGVLSPLLLLACLPLLQLKRRNWYLSTFVLIVLYVGLALIFSGARVRYLAPLLVPSVCLTLFGLVQLSEWLPSKLRSAVVWAFALIHVCLAIWYGYGISQRNGTLDYLTARPTPKEFYRKRFAVYPMIEYVNHNLANADGLYLLYTGNLFYLYNVPVQGQHDSGRPVLSWLKSGRSAAHIAQHLKTRGVDHLLIHRGRLLRYLNDPGHHLSVVERKEWNEFVELYLEEIHRDEQYSLMRRVVEVTDAPPAADAAAL